MGSIIEVDKDYWRHLGRHTPLAIISDLDGTLVPFAATPEAARPTPEIRELLSELAALPGVTLVIASGRPHATLDEFFPRPRQVLLVAEHGAWRSTPEGWEPMMSFARSDKTAMTSLAVQLNDLRQRYPAALLELKTWSLAFHFRRVSLEEKPGLVERVGGVVDPWLEAHPDFERLAGVEVIEIRPRLASKANAVRWARSLLGPSCRLVMAGDDTTDEDMFRAASDQDAAILVGEPNRPTAARWRLRSSNELQAFYRWIAFLRCGLPPAPTGNGSVPSLPIRSTPSSP
jgi:trehalose-phosphatase